MKTLRLFALFILMSSFAMAQIGGAQHSTSNDAEKISIPEEISRKIDDFFKIMIAGDIKPAYKGLLKDSPILEKEDDLVNLVEQTKRSIKIYGEIKDYEPVSIEKATQSFIRLRYLGLHTKFPMRWLFTFYNSPDKGWIITNVKFDDMSEFFFKDE